MNSCNFKQLFAECKLKSLSSWRRARRQAGGAGVSAVRTRKDNDALRLELTPDMGY
jgi:hypothetical protein